MNKKQFLRLTIQLAGFEVINVDFDNSDGWDINFIDKSRVGYFIEGMKFEIALGNLLAMLYDTKDIDFEANAAILFDN